ncbi:tetratricopeptide (TPR) repeat protein [Wenzhouxiangella marina]|nr:sulfotransferase [Wenzhouxiangella marina]MBB6085864.1 tetratricopeptide (TPR) repeat protein [Wenzhouxiangella marina]
MTPDSRVFSIEPAERLFASGQASRAERWLREHADQPLARARLREYWLVEGRKAEVMELVQAGETRLDRAVEAFIAGRPAEALAWCDGELAEHPDDAYAALNRARCLHNLGQPAEALEAFRRLVQAHPGLPEAWYSFAHALRAAGHEAPACQAYEEALKLAPGLRAARFNLGLTLLNLDRAEEAKACFERLLDANADDVEAMVHLGLALHMNGQSELAVRRLKRALMHAPGHPQAHRFLAGIYNQAGHAELALEHLEKALAAHPDDPELLAELADIHELSSRLDAARAAVERGLAQAPGHPQLRLMAARLDRRAGNLEAAHSNLSAVRPEALPPRLGLQHAQEAGLLMDRLGKADEAMLAFERANELAGRDGRKQAVDRQAFGRELERMGDWLQRGASARGELPGADRGEDLIFLIGFTRSGTTLLDTFFGPLAQVQSVEEKPTFERLIIDAARQGVAYPFDLDAMSVDELEGLRQRYRQHLGRFLPAGGAERTIDRMPLRLIHAATLGRLFPGARFLLAERHPCDVVLSNFMQIFEPGDALVHCDTLASTVSLYDAVMRLWWQTEPLVADRLVRVRYEALVADPETELRRSCAALDLEFDPAMLEQRHRGSSEKRVRTASYQQVHEPIYRRAASRWERYRAHFEPHLQQLEPHAERLGYPSLR